MKKPRPGATCPTSDPIELINPNLINLRTAYFGLILGLGGKKGGGGTGDGAIREWRRGGYLRRERQVKERG